MLLQMLVSRGTSPDTRRVPLHDTTSGPFRQHNINKHSLLWPLLRVHCRNTTGIVISRLSTMVPPFKPRVRAAVLTP